MVCQDPALEAFRRSQHHVGTDWPSLKAQGEILRTSCFSLFLISLSHLLSWTWGLSQQSLDVGPPRQGPSRPQFLHLFETIQPNRRFLLHFDDIGDSPRGWGRGRMRNSSILWRTSGCTSEVAGQELNLTVSKLALYSVWGTVSAPLGSHGGGVLLTTHALSFPKTWAEGGQGGGSTSAQPVWSTSDNERSVQRAGRAWQRPGSSWGQAQLPTPTPDKERPGPGELAAFPPLGAPVGGAPGRGRRGLCLTPPLPPPARPQLSNSVSRRQGWRA